MNTIYYFNFNNYTNRVVKGFATLTEYMQNAEYIGKSNTVNFNKTNDLEANVVCYLDNYKSPDYALLCEEDTIVSRWFVISETRGNKNNYQLNLKRDIIYDNLDLILNNENTLIKRGYAKDTESAILNDEEPFSFNEYKREEWEIKLPKNDYSWLAFFIANKQESKIPVARYESTNEAYFTSTLLAQSLGTKFTFRKKYIENIDALYNGKKGYSMVLVPAVIFTEYDNYKNCNVKFSSKYSTNAEEIIETVSIEDDSTTVCEAYMPASELVSFIINNFLANETFVDIQYIPYIEGYDYYKKYGETSSDPDSLVIRTKYTNYELGDPKVETVLYYQKYAKTLTEAGYRAICLPICENAVASYEYSMFVSLLAPGYDANASKKLLECSKLYIESPDRSSSAKIDLRKFINKNTGEIEGNTIGFKVSCCYQPFQSYVYVYPYQVGTYYDLNKEDGQYLLCGYNNQILRTSDAWINYLLNNKNYLNSFNLQLRDAKINAVTGSLASGISGATTGAVLGGGVGATALGLASAGAKGIESAVNINEMKQQFKWSCDNLQSQPQSVSKVSTFTPMNTIYPVLSVYYNDEVIADDYKLFKNYLKMNGFTINKIDTIKNHYTQEYQYVSAEIIRLDDFKGTAVELQEIQDEISKGLFFQE